MPTHFETVCIWFLFDSCVLFSLVFSASCKYTRISILSDSIVPDRRSIQKKKSCFEFGVWMTLNKKKWVSCSTTVKQMKPVFTWAFFFRVIFVCVCVFEWNQLWRSNTERTQWTIEFDAVFISFSLSISVHLCSLREENICRSYSCTMTHVTLIAGNQYVLRHRHYSSFLCLHFAIRWVSA